jgi:hypothetical protein
MNNLHYPTNTSSSLNQGLWNASTNSPDLTLIDISDSANAGKFWTVSNEGTTDISDLNLDSITSVEQGDQLTILSNEWTQQSAGISVDLVDAKISAIFDGLTEGQIVKKGSGNTLVDSSVDDSGTTTEFDKSIKIPASSLDVGYDITLSDAGGNLMYEVNSTSEKRVVITTGFDETGSTSQPFTTDFEAEDLDVDWQAIDTDTLTSTQFEFSRTTTANEFVYDCKYKIGATVPVDPVYFCVYRGSAIDEDKLLAEQVIEPEDFTANSDYTLTLDPILGFYSGQTLYFVIKSDTAFDLLGSSSLDIPYLAVDRQVGTFTALARVTDIPTRAYGKGAITSTTDEIEANTVNQYYTVDVPLTLSNASNVSLTTSDSSNDYDNALSVDIDGIYKIDVSAIWKMTDNNSETITGALYKNNTKISDVLSTYFYSSGRYLSTSGCDLVSLEAGDIIYLKIASSVQYADVVFSKLSIMLNKEN